MERELYAALKQMVESGECFENMFAILYITAGYPEHCYEDYFCEWANQVNPSHKEIVEYFLKEK
jgi:hypothetical protein